MLVSADGGCSYDDAAEFVFNSTAAAGALVAQRADDAGLLRPLGTYDSAWHAQSATMVPRRAAAELRAALRDAGSSAPLTLNFTAASVPGYFAGVTSAGALYQLGWPQALGVQDLQFVAWEGR